MLALVHLPASSGLTEPILISNFQTRKLYAWYKTKTFRVKGL